jgi:hypothetical protein
MALTASVFLFVKIPQNERYNDWRLKNDDRFAMAYCTSVPAHLSTPGIRCCNICKGILLKVHGDDPVILRLTDFIEYAKRCSVCQLILRASVETVNEQGNIQLLCSDSGLRAELGGRRLLRFSASPGEDSR